LDRINFVAKQGDNVQEMTAETQPAVSFDAMRLRPLSLDDIDVLAAWGADDELCGAAEWSIGKPLDYHRRHWRTLIEDRSADLVRLAAVMEDDRPVGYCDLFGRNADRRELGFVIAERHLWGHGLGQRAAALMLEYGFGELNLRTIWAEVWDANSRSIRLLQRLGMREVGRGETGTYRDLPTWYRVFEITADEWAAGPAQRS
jgi:RimJ/RimL family protein N-acetyltransferase